MRITDEAVQAGAEALPDRRVVARGGGLSVVPAARRREREHQARRVLKAAAPYLEPGDTLGVLQLDEHEEAVMGHLALAYRGILDMGLRANEVELASAMHALQGFVVQHMLHRLAPADWNAWYDDDLAAERRAAAGRTPADTDEEATSG